MRNLRAATSLLLLSGALIGFAIVLVEWPAIKRFFYSRTTPIAFGYHQNGPIRFYGRVIDQEGNGVANATVIGEYSAFLMSDHLHDRDFAPHPIQALTDAHGNFTLTNLTGTRLVWNNVQAPDCKYLQPIRVYVYYNDAPPIFTPNPASPEIFHVWHASEPPAHLTNVRAGKDVAVSGQTYSIWLGSPGRVEAGKSPDCDLQFTLEWVAPKDDGKSGTPPAFDWDFVIDVPSGGVIATQDAYLYEAPVAGYQSHYEFRQPAKAPKWSFDNRSQRNYYFLCRGGAIFSAINIDASIEPRLHSAYFSIRGVMNDQGSRNLAPGG